METKLSEVERNSLPIAGVGPPPPPGGAAGCGSSLEGAGESADVCFNFSVFSPGWFVSCECRALSETKSLPGLRQVAGAERRTEQNKLSNVSKILRQHPD